MSPPAQLVSTMSTVRYVKLYSNEMSDKHPYMQRKPYTQLSFLFHREPLPEPQTNHQSNGTFIHRLVLLLSKHKL